MGNQQSQTASSEGITARSGCATLRWEVEDAGEFCAFDGEEAGFCLARAMGGEAAEFAICGENAVAGNDEGDGIFGHGLAYGA